MPRKIKRKGTKRNPEDEEIVFQTEIHDPDISDDPITIAITPKLASNVDHYIRSLRASRGIKTSLDYDDSRVRFYLDRHYSPEEAFDAASTLYQDDMTEARQEGVMAVLLYDCFVVEDNVVQLRPDFNEEIQIEEKYWNPQEDNILREEAFLPPPPTMNRRHPVEVRAAYVKYILAASPLIQTQILDLVPMLWEASQKSEDEGETDENGFHDTPLDRNMDGDNGSDGEEEEGVREADGEV